MDIWTQIELITVITSFIAGAIAWYIKVQLKDVRRDIKDLKNDIEHVAAETRTNGGRSIKDQVSRLEDRTNEADHLRRDMNEKIDKMYIILIDYIAAQNSKKRSKSKSDI